jgi:hypothetical protein
MVIFSNDLKQLIYECKCSPHVQPKFVNFLGFLITEEEWKVGLLHLHLNNPFNEQHIYLTTQSKIDWFKHG